uniref:Uncharacterized protein n=1 Tax=Anguilla anguilla TaxID=7936 RepID=A0A0E9VV78_ANGAN
MQFFVFCFRI